MNKKLNINSSLEKSKTETWNGRHKGLCYEVKITKHKERQASICGYVILPEKCFKNYFFSYYIVPTQINIGFNNPLMSHKESSGWPFEVHGGITYINILNPLEFGNRHIKYGWDYNHLMDEGIDYSVEYVADDCKELINKIHAYLSEKYPDDPFLYHSQEDGNYYPLEVK